MLHLCKHLPPAGLQLLRHLPAHISPALLPLPRLSCCARLRCLLPPSSLRCPSLCWPLRGCPLDLLCLSAGLQQLQCPGSLQRLHLLAQPLVLTDQQLSVLCMALALLGHNGVFCQQALVLSRQGLCPSLDSPKLL